MSETERGTVKWFNGSKRYGFIAPAAGDKDLFFHGSAVLSDADSDAMDGGGEGIAVSFMRGTRDGRPIAVGIKIVEE